MLELYKNYFKKPTWADLKAVFDEDDARTRYLNIKHPWVAIITNWVAVLLAILIVIACFGWGLDIHTERKAADLTAVALAEYQQEQEAAELERQRVIAEQQASEQAVIDRETDLIAKLFSGISNFEEKYGYSENDFMTYARCAFNRVDNAAYSDNLDAVINQDSQWVGYSQKNEILSKYKTMARKAVEEWHKETSKPISTDFVYAELTDRGIYLKSDYNADGYARRWRYGS